MIIHNFSPIFIDLVFFQIRWYSIAYIMGIVLGWWFANRIIENNTIYKRSNITTKIFDDLIIYIIIGIIMGGRIGYIVFYNLEYYSENFIDSFKLWEGGMSFHGGLIGVVFGTIIFSKIKKINFFRIADIIACVSPIGIFFGRLANFINGELYGKVSSVPWAIIFPKIDNFPRHPSQIYEAILEGLILLLVVNFFSFKKNMILEKGYTSGIFLIFYSIFRLLSEIFREPDNHIGYFFDYYSMGMILSFGTLISGLLIILYIKKNEKNN